MKKGSVKKMVSFPRALCGVLMLLLLSETYRVRIVSQKNQVNLSFDSAFVSFRIGLGQSLSAKRFEELVRYFEQHKRVTSEITFFTSITHPPPPLKVLQERVAILKERMVYARQHGFRSGINILNTVGHLNENLDNSLKGNYTHMTDIEGKTYEGAFCPNDERYRREYIIPVYKATAEAGPDYIWIDDDVRLRGYGNIHFACFCDRCLEIFRS